MVIVKSCPFIIVACTILLASSPEISITGTVKDGSLPLNGAIVSLVSDATIVDTTGTDGTFELTNATGTAGLYDPQLVRKITMGINGTELLLSLPYEVTEGAITFYSGNGKRITNIPLNKLSAGKHQVELPALSSGFYMMRIEAGRFTATRKMIVTGTASYLNGSASQQTVNSALLGKKMQNEVDQIKVEKEGYVTATIGIESYQQEGLEIELSEESSGPCSGGKLATTDVTKKGPFEIVVENNVSNLQDGGCMLVRPKEFTEGCLHPVVTWGNGTQSQTVWYQAVLEHLASHGFIVIASNSGDVQQGNPPLMVQAAQWVVDQNDNSSSPMYQKVDTEHIGATGHSKGGYAATEAATNPLVMTSVSSCGATGSSNQQGPALILCGQQDNNSGARCSDHPEDAYNGINNVPVMKAEHRTADHGWCMDFGGGGGGGEPHDMLIAMTAWFRYHLMDDEEYKSWFYGSDCYLCDHQDWTVKSKNMD